jgi:hypothetical protein
MATRSKFDPATESRRWILYIVLIILVSWVGLWGLTHLSVNSTTKTLFLGLLFSAITSTMMPPIAYLNARFGKFEDRRTYWARSVRQSVWVGACVVVIAWMQMQRILTPTLVVITIAVFALIETFLITREAPTDE